MVKRLENFWKGLSNEVRQISPIPPEGYGDRFIKFITGITKTREEAAREEAEAAAREADVTLPVEGGRKRSGSQHLHRTGTENTVIQRAEAQAIHTEEEGAREDERPERTLLSVRSPSAERGGATVLPVVEEAGEASSTGGKSGDLDTRPPTPAKDYVPDSRGRVSRDTVRERRPPTPPKDANALAPADSKSVKSWKDKALPIIPGREVRVGEAF